MGLTLQTADTANNIITYMHYQHTHTGTTDIAYSLSSYPQIAALSTYPYRHFGYYVPYHLVNALPEYPYGHCRCCVKLHIAPNNTCIHKVPIQTMQKLSTLVHRLTSYPYILQLSRYSYSYCRYCRPYLPYLLIHAQPRYPYGHCRQ